MFALVDCNNFYASCERVFNPKLKNKPVVVLSNNDGCVIARSNESKALGIPMGAPAYQFKGTFKKHGIEVFSSNFALYADMSNRVMSILAEFTPAIEVYSIDESFLKFEGFEDWDLVEYGVKIKGTVLKQTGIPISIGLAPTKALSKIANKIAKKFPEQTHGVYKIDTEEARIKALKWTKIGDVWGIGRRIAERLKAIGITNAYAFTLLPEEFVRSEFSVVGLRLQKELKGFSVLDLEETKNKKAIATTRSFKSDISDFEEVKERIATFAITCAEKLRHQGSYGNLIQVFVKTNKFKAGAPSHQSIVVQLPYATNSSITIAKYAVAGLKSIFKQGFKYKKAGVVVMGLAPNDAKQINLFMNENPKHEQLMKAIDNVNRREGYKAVKLGSQNIKKTWIMRREHLSQRYTTHWDEILEVS